MFYGKINAGHPSTSYLNGFLTKSAPKLASKQTSRRMETVGKRRSTVEGLIWIGLPVIQNYI
jgi:hypothetical protein